MKKTLVAIALLCGFVLAEEQSGEKILDMKTLVDFSQRNALSSLVLDEGMTINRRAGTVTVPARSETQVTLWSLDQREQPIGATCDEVRIRLESTAKGLINTTWRVYAGESRASAQCVLDPGANEIRIPLVDLYRDDRKSTIDWLHVKSLALAFGRMKEPFVFRGCLCHWD